MTVVVAWKRKLKQGPEELCFASDSRLRDGRTIDFAQKIFTLNRGDAAIAFAGDTAIAYPYILQVINSLDGFIALRTRGMDIIEVRAHIIKILNQIVDGIETPIEEEKIPNVEIILGGYSWIKKEFYIWHIHYFKKLKKFHYDSAKNWGHVKKCIAFAGDKGSALMEKFSTEMRSIYGRSVKDMYLDLEPLKCLTDMLLKSRSNSTIGFPPQFAKVYQHLNARQIPVCYKGNIYYCGRKLFGYERIDRWPLSLSTFESIDPELIGENNK